jgi:hypothetical protein
MGSAAERRLRGESPFAFNARALRTMRTPWLGPPAILLSLASCTSVGEFFAPPAGAKSLVIEVGRRTLEDSEFDGLDKPTTYGLGWSMKDPELPIGFELGLHHHRESRRLPATGSTDFESTELSLGVRQTFDPGGLALQPYIALGLSLFYSERVNELAPIIGQSGSDLDSGAYARVGLNAPLTEHLFLGLDYRYLYESLFEYGGYDLDGSALTLRLGWSF